MVQQLFFEVVGGDGFFCMVDDIFDVFGDYQIVVVVVVDQVVVVVEVVWIEVVFVVVFGSKIVVQCVGFVY